MPRKSKTNSPKVPEVVRENPDAALVLRRFRQIFNSVKTHFQQLEKRSGLGGAKVWAISLIAQRPGIGTGALALAMDIHQSTASNLVKVLIENKMVEAQKTGADRRSVQLFIMPSASRMLKKVPGPFTGVLPDALERLDKKTLKNLNRDLSRLTELLSRVDDKSAQTPLAEL